MSGLGLGLGLANTGLHLGLERTGLGLANTGLDLGLGLARSGLGLGLGLATAGLGYKTANSHVCQTPLLALASTRSKRWLVNITPAALP